MKPEKIYMKPEKNPNMEWDKNYISNKDLIYEIYKKINLVANKKQTFKN
jgi:hypothetical protein